MTEKNNYHYKESGLDNVFLANGWDVVPSPSGQQLKIKDIEGLHRAIGNMLVEQKKNLNGKELRFLRQEMLLSQANLAKLIEVTEQTIHRWETGKADIPKPAESLIRFLYRGQFDKLEIRESLERLADLEDHADGMDYIAKKQTNQRWCLHVADAA
jgi:putative transcriptional regulator